MCVHFDKRLFANGIRILQAKNTLDELLLHFCSKLNCNFKYGNWLTETAITNNNI